MRAAVSQPASPQPSCLTRSASLHRQNIKTGRCHITQLSRAETRNEPLAAEWAEHLKTDLGISCKRNQKECVTSSEVFVGDGAVGKRCFVQINSYLGMYLQPNY